MCDNNFRSRSGVRMAVMLPSMLPIPNSRSIMKSQASSLWAISANCSGNVVFSFSIHSKTLSMETLLSARLNVFSSSKRVLEDD
ncbi:hypothetical protein EYF80_028625 [Liparis tanakae]|uniref:Uncharacterized protein n=1 Tax=Liparis tanakae TaxID=230148 RepID=A0A4Z2H5H8_9TELE|nr:hypothetical protein EYF80_028625 [Liparis tanakae]